MHAPLTQRRMPVQAPCVPHWQLPAAEHVSARPPAVQSTHARPARPQLVAVAGLVHVFPTQHPSGHEVASHVHAPDRHR
jgi:hypothetical protein